MQIQKQLGVPISNNTYDGNGNSYSFFSFSIHRFQYMLTKRTGDIGFYEGNQNWFNVKQNPISEARLYAQVELFKYHLSENYAQV